MWNISWKGVNIGKNRENKRKSEGQIERYKGSRGKDFEFEAVLKWQTLIILRLREMVSCLWALLAFAGNVQLYTLWFTKIHGSSSKGLRTFHTSTSSRHAHAIHIANDIQEKYSFPKWKKTYLSKTTVFRITVYHSLYCHFLRNVIFHPEK